MIIIRLDRMMVDRKISSKELAYLINLSPVNFSKLKRGKIKSIKIEILNSLCKHLQCKPKDLLEYQPDFDDDLI